ncbi:MAG: hypothetical protein ACJ78K_10990 [Gemmatimonadaceae bacterium]
MQHIEAFAATLRRGPGAGGKMRVHCTAFALITLATTSLLGCTRHVQVKDYDEPAPTPAVAGPIVLEVENHNWSDVVLFVISDGSTHRLAEVAAAHAESIEIPTHLLGNQGRIRLGLHRIGGRDDYRTETVSIRTGSTIRLTIEGKLEHSSIGVW